MGGIMMNGGYFLNGCFTKWSTLAGSGVHFSDDYDSGVVNLEHCEIYSGNIISRQLTLNFTNCLFFRNKLNDSFIGMGYNIRNSTFEGGNLQLARYQHDNYWWTVKDTAFDGTSFSISDWYHGTNYTTFDYNAYNTAYTNWQTLEVVGPHDIQTNFCPWQTSWFGNYYQATNSTLLHAGSTTADQVGLYHFTVTTNQAVEGASQVSIGYHYVATDQYGNPLDTNGDGIPDYLEDANGNGIYDAGDLGDWLVNPYNGLTRANGLLVFPPVKILGQ
jgi:hypothetical protein